MCYLIYASATQEAFIAAINNNKIELVKKLMKSLKDRAVYDQALKIAAINGNLNIANLLAPRASRKAHREAYQILRQQNLELSIYGDSDLENIVYNK